MEKQNEPLQSLVESIVREVVEKLLAEGRNVSKTEDF